MAIFDKRIENKLDDTINLNCIIETAQKVNNHIEYVLRVQRGPYKENSWKLLRRYNDFFELNNCFKNLGISLPFPRKKIFNNMHPEFIAQRRAELQEFMNIVLMNPILASSLIAKRFVDPDSYSIPFHDLALQNASMCLRTEGNFSLGPSLGNIGWRLRKHYFKVFQKQNSKNSPGQPSAKHHLVKSTSQPQSKHNPCTNGSQDGQEYLLSWTEYGPDKFIDEKEIQNVFKNLGGIQHPYIWPLEHIITNDNGALVIRKFHKPGTLKDILCGSQPLNPFLTKYGNPKGRAPLPLKEVALYGRQILEALRFLHSKGLAYGHIHAGNVIIKDGAAHLIDVENYLLGVPSFYRPFFVQFSKINNFEAIDVYSFGHLMYEMTMGYSLQESVVRVINDCPDSLKSFLESILTRDALKISVPTLDQLVSHPFFTEYAGNFNEIYAQALNITKPHLKLSTVAKEQIKICSQKIELRLRDEQKSVKNQKRLVRVQECLTLSSEEEKKKIKQKAKLEHRQAKLRQQNSLQLQNDGPSQQIKSSQFNRSDSVNSCTTTPTTTPPLPLPPSSLALLPTTSTLPPPPPPPPHLLVVDDNLKIPDKQRNALLDSICNFKKGSLKRTEKHE